LFVADNVASFFVAINIYFSVAMDRGSSHP